MSILTVKAMNENLFFWPSVRTDSPITSFSPADSPRVNAVFFGSRQGLAANQIPPDYRERTPDDDIRDGEVHRFKTPKALLRALKSGT